MKKIVILFLCFVCTAALAQVDIRYQQIENNINDLNFRVSRLKNDLKLIEKQTLEKISLIDSSSNKSLNDIVLQLKNFEMHNQSELAEFKQTNEHLQKNITKSHKRQKIHFIILYILLFVTMVGVVFVFVYFSKLAKDFDLFQKKRLDDLKNDVKLIIDSNHKYLVSKVDTACDEVKAQTLVSEERMNDSYKSVVLSVETVKSNTFNQISSLELKQKSMEKELNEQKELINENAQLRKQLEFVSKQLEKHIIEFEKKIAALKKSKTPAKKSATRKKPTA